MTWFVSYYGEVRTEMSLPASCKKRKDIRMGKFKIKVVIKRPDEEYGHMTNISNTLENLQKTVEGYIEVITLGKLAIIMNEEGKLRGLPPNMPLGNDIIVGTIIICGIQDEDFADIPVTFAEWKKTVDNLRSTQEIQSGKDFE